MKNNVKGYLCLPLRRKTISKVAHEVQKRRPEINMYEIWLDQMPAWDEASLLKVIRAAKKPVLFVCKTPKDSGKFRGGEIQRIERLLTAVRGGAAYIDCSRETATRHLKLLRKECKKYAARLILSVHHWNRTPSIHELVALAYSIHRKGCDIVKIATHIRTYSDTTILFELCMRLQAARIKYIVTGMGEKSTIARIGCALLGSEITYVAATKKSTTAPGQLTIREWRNWMIGH